MYGSEAHTEQREDAENGMGSSDRICQRMPIDEVPCFQIS